MDEAEAISHLKRGDPSGLKILVENYQTEAVRVAYLIVRDRSLAEDVVQAAFIKVYERRRQFDASRPFAPWFMRMVANDGVKALRRRRREIPLQRSTDGEAVDLGDLMSDSAPGPSALAEEAELREAIWEAVGRLAPQQRRAIVLRYYLELKEAEVAEEMGRAPGTIKRLLHDARGRLRALLGQRAWSDGA
ncbi:MAG: RNA polymerase sigma factor [Dehalococcoidia bacterium]